MQFTESEIQEILQENQMLKKDLSEAREELEATNKLYDTCGGNEEPAAPC